jgi:Fic-DOC domain mobile mystery protein B
MGLMFNYPDGATPLDPSEIEGLIPDITTQAELNEMEMLNILEAMPWANTNRKIRDEILSISGLQVVHRRMFGKTWRWAGKFRLTQKSIGIEPYRIQTELRQLVDDTKTWLEFKTYSPQETCARFHHRLVFIHPFPNGNGRHARMATDIFCLRNGWPLSTWGAARFLSSQELRSKYIGALKAADQKEIGPLVNFMFDPSG